MSSINGLGGNLPVQRTVSQHHQPTPASGPTSPAATDKVELSSAAQAQGIPRNDGQIRFEKVALIKAQIEARTYESDAKLSIAVDRLLSELTRA
jgi:anti-sigma28 factor (negative regulator of flagellin synthesis)